MRRRDETNLGVIARLDRGTQHSIDVGCVRKGAASEILEAPVKPEHDGGEDEQKRSRGTNAPE
jgi:hypothetical protein